jgi:hypothetical protein
MRVVTPKAETFEQVVTKFLEQHVHRNSLRTAREIERIIHKDLMPLWRTREFKSIRRSDVARMLDAKEIHAPVQADYILSVLSKLCNWYMVRDEDYISPFVRWMRRTKPSQRARQRIFDDNELRHFWQATGEVTTRYSYEDEKTEALSKLSDLIERIIAPEAKVTNPIPMRFRVALEPSELSAVG